MQNSKQDQIPDPNHSRTNCSLKTQLYIICSWTLCFLFLFCKTIRLGEDWPSKMKYHSILLELHINNRNIPPAPTDFKTLYDKNNNICSLLINYQNLSLFCFQNIYNIYLYHLSLNPSLESECLFSYIISIARRPFCFPNTK